jgi:quinol monooxygenase YgiN
MITLIATIKIKEGKIDDAIELLKEIAPKIKEAESGCIEYLPHTVKGSNNTIIFYEKYKDSEALKKHNANIPKSLAKLLPLLEPGMDVKTCFEIL